LRSGRHETGFVHEEKEKLELVSTTEVAKDVFRIAVFVPEINLEFSHFLVRDEEPLLFHAGLRGMFPILREQVSRLIDLKDSARWIQPFRVRRMWSFE